MLGLQCYKTDLVHRFFIKFNLNFQQSRRRVCIDPEACRNKWVEWLHTISSSFSTMDVRIHCEITVVHSSFPPSIIHSFIFCLQDPTSVACRSRRWRRTLTERSSWNLLNGPALFITRRCYFLFTLKVARCFFCVHFGTRFLVCI